MLRKPKIIQVDGHAPAVCPDRSLESIWVRVAAVLNHYAWFNADESRVRDMQHAIVQHSALLVPSLFGEGGDHCSSSFYFQQRIFYHFTEGPEEYFWITSLLDRCYSLAVLYFPAKGIAVSLYPYTVDTPLLRGFERMRAAQHRPVASLTAQTLVVIGYHHMIHTLWNELPALERVISAGLSPRLRIAVTHQPLGPLERLFPELHGRVEPYPVDALQSLNETVGMFTALGAWSIPKSTRARVARTARELAPSASLSEQEHFRREHQPILWLSVKPPERTCSDQVETLAAIIQGFRAAYPKSGFLLDGVSYPWDYDSNQNYLEWYRSIMETASAKTSEIINAVVGGLSVPLRRSVRVVTDVSVMEEVTWGGIADFYFCHGGSMQNKMGWIHPVAGVVHSNQSFADSAKGMIPPVENAAKVYYLPQNLIVDDDPARYTSLQLARKDQNYSFISADDVLQFILDSFSDSRAASGDNANLILDLGAVAPKAQDMGLRLDPQRLEHTVPPMVSDEERIAIATRSHDCDSIPKVADAGQVQVENGTRVQIMHNGLRVVADGYCGAWMTRLIQLCRGHHEGQEERIFHQIISSLSPTATMIELGGYWAYYSLWFLKDAPGRRAFVLEPDPQHLEIGRANAKLNGLQPHFRAGFVGRTEVPAMPFETQSSSVRQLPCYTVQQLMREWRLDELDLLHCDTQGAEFEILESCLPVLREGRIRWLLVSTHAEIISEDPLTHQRCLATLVGAGGTIVAEHDVHESFSGDGLIAACFGPLPSGWVPIKLSYNRYSESLFRNPLYDLALTRKKFDRDDG